MEMEKQFKVIIEDEDVWVSEVWGSKRRKMLHTQIQIRMYLSIFNKYLTLHTH